MEKDFRVSDFLKQKTPEEQMSRKLVQSIVDKNKDKDFVKRILNPKSVKPIENEDGSVSTHRMAWGETDGKFVVFPTIVRKGKKLVDLGEDAFHHAMKTGEFIEFNDPKQADWFSKNYKLMWD